MSSVLRSDEKFDLGFYHTGTEKRLQRFSSRKKNPSLPFIPVSLVARAATLLSSSATVTRKESPRKVLRDGHAAPQLYQSDANRAAAHRPVPGRLGPDRRQWKTDSPGVCVGV